MLTGIPPERVHKIWTVLHLPIITVFESEMSEALERLCSDPPPHPLDVIETDIDVCNVGSDISVFRWPLTAN